MGEGLELYSLVSMICGGKMVHLCMYIYWLCRAGSVSHTCLIGEHDCKAKYAHSTEQDIQDIQHCNPLQSKVYNTLGSATG